MARYIDADALLNRLPDDLPYKASVKRVLIQAPTADVAPKSEVAYWQDEAVNAKREAVKEFANRLKKYYASLNGNTAAGCVEYHIDQIAKEMIGERGE